MPPRLLLLDAPDVDSDVTVNWHRARAIRQAADVLVAVLTQQKYNDAAVKQFFRAAVEAEKPIVVVFNQCELEADREYWPQWLATFCEQTGARPELVYVVPYDRRAADGVAAAVLRGCNELPSPPGEGQGVRATDSNRNALSEAALTLTLSQRERGLLAKANLRDDLAALHFDAIKIRTFRGALRRVLDPQHGVPAYLGFDPRGGPRVLGGGRGPLGPRDGPRGLALAAGRRAGRRNPPLVGRFAAALVAADSRLLSRRGPGRDLARAGRLERPGRTAAGPDRRLPTTGTCGRS